MSASPKMTRDPVLAAFGIVFAAALLFPPAARAHGVEAARESGGAGVVETVRFSYSTGEAMMYAKVRLYPPSSPETEIYQGLADRNGLFSFTPDEAGTWRVSAEDGMGHKGEITLAAAGAEGAAAAAGSGGGGLAGGGAGGSKPPVPLAALLGVSLLCNAYALWFFWKTRRGTVRREGSGCAH